MCNHSTILATLIGLTFMVGQLTGCSDQSGSFGGSSGVAKTATNSPRNTSELSGKPDTPLNAEIKPAANTDHSGVAVPPTLGESSGGSDASRNSGSAPNPDPSDTSTRSGSAPNTIPTDIPSQSGLTPNTAPTDISSQSGLTPNTDPPSGGTNIDAPPAPVVPPAPTLSTIIDTIAKVGINFEDGGLKGGGSDKDYNDAVLCFGGKFAVDMLKRSIISNIDQSVVARFSRRASCNNYMRITVLDTLGKTTYTKDVTTANATESQVTINFKKGDTLKLFLLAGAACNNGGKTIGF